MINMNLKKDLGRYVCVYGEINNLNVIHTIETNKKVKIFHKLQCSQSQRTQMFSCIIALQCCWTANNKKQMHKMTDGKVKFLQDLQTSDNFVSLATNRWCWL